MYKYIRIYTVLAGHVCVSLTAPGSYSHSTPRFHPLFFHVSTPEIPPDIMATVTLGTVTMVPGGERVGVVLPSVTMTTVFIATRQCTHY